MLYEVITSLVAAELGDPQAVEMERAASAYFVQQSVPDPRAVARVLLGRIGD